MAKYVNLAAVDSGCSKIDEAITMFENVKTMISNASDYLDKNSLRFGSINSTLEEQLDIIKNQIVSCKSMNDGITSTIKANAQAQYQEYLDYQEQLRKASTKKA